MKSPAYYVTKQYFLHACDSEVTSSTNVERQTPVHAYRMICHTLYLSLNPSFFILFTKV